MHLLLAGRNVTQDNTVLFSQCIDLDITAKVTFLGQLDETWQFYQMIDIFILPSLTEGFPNVVGEAMSCEIPCVVTKAGDAPNIIGDTGIIIEGYDVSAIKKALMVMLGFSKKHRKLLGAAARHRIINKFSIKSIAQQYQQLYFDAFT